jgi:hypothetical protein
MQTGFLIYAFFFNLFRVAFTPFLECAGEFASADATRELLRKVSWTFKPFFVVLGCILFSGFIFLITEIRLYLKLRHNLIPYCRDDRTGTEGYSSLQPEEDGWEKPNSGLYLSYACNVMVL